MRAVKTDAFGRFRFQINKNISEGNKFARLLIQDSTKRYSPKETQPQIFNINSFIIIMMKPRLKKEMTLPTASWVTEKEIIVSTEATFYSNIEVGDSIIVKATGTVCLGPIAGCFGPEGTTDHTYDAKSYFPKLNHGSLLAKLGDGEWFLVGSYRAGLAQRNGDLQFLVNDKETWNNSGNFRVSIRVIKNNHKRLNDTLDKRP